jgi:hypothetical protein
MTPKLFILGAVRPGYRDSPLLPFLKGSMGVFGSLPFRLSLLKQYGGYTYDKSQVTWNALFYIQP